MALTLASLLHRPRQALALPLALCIRRGLAVLQRNPVTSLAFFPQPLGSLPRMPPIPPSDSLGPRNKPTLSRHRLTKPSTSDSGLEMLCTWRLTNAAR